MTLDLDRVRVIRSRRKTFSATVANDGTVLVKAPLAAAKQDILAFVLKHEDWILARQKEVRKNTPEETLTMDEIRELGNKALRYIPERVRLYAQKMGLKYGKITIRNQKSRWGSCSSKKNLNFNCLLMLCPERVIDSVVVHELSHLVHMNHSREFYSLVLSVFPDYWECDRWLKENGEAIMRRMTG